jgi:signal transduction histidine kinase
VHTIITLKLVRRALLNREEGVEVLVGEALEQTERATAELRELAHGILPSILTRGGLRAGVEALASRMPMPVRIGVSVERLPDVVEATAYFVVAEALTNVAKYAHASHATVRFSHEDGAMVVEVRDDGVGGADASRGSGLRGLADRVSALGGELAIESSPGNGTTIRARIALSGQAAAAPAEAAPRTLARAAG